MLIALKPHREFSYYDRLDTRKGIEMKSKLARSIQSYPIISFFAISILLSFGLLFPATNISRNGIIGQVLGYFLARLGIYSPVIAGITVSYFVNSRKVHSPFTHRLLIFLPVWIIATIVHTADLSLTAPTDTSFFFLAILSALVALLPAFVVTLSLSRIGGIRKMLESLTRPKGHFVYYFAAVLCFPIIHFAGLIVTNIQNGQSAFPTISIDGNVLFPVLVSFFSVMLFTGGLNEESGWRGFAQKHLQGRHSPLVANLILWIFLVVWHVPSDLIQYQHGSYLLIRLGMYPFITILFGWIYNRAGGSILVPVLFHASMNSMNQLGDVLPMTTAGNVILIALTLVVILADRMWQKLPSAHPAVFSDEIGSGIGDNYNAKLGS